MIAEAVMAVVDTLALVTAPDVRSELLVTAAADKGPVDTLALVKCAVRNPALVTGPERTIELAVTADAVSAAVLRPALLNTALRRSPVAVIAAAVKPAVLTLPECIRPVTKPAFMAREPRTVLVRPVCPITTVALVGPTRTIPLLAPVPASNTRSPPVLPAPAA